MSKAAPVEDKISSQDRELASIIVPAMGETDDGNDFNEYKEEPHVSETLNDNKKPRVAGEVIYKLPTLLARLDNWVTRKENASHLAHHKVRVWYTKARLHEEIANVEPDKMNEHYSAARRAYLVVHKYGDATYKQLATEGLKYVNQILKIH